MFEFDDEEDDQSCEAQRNWKQYDVVSELSWELETQRWLE